MEIEKEYRYKVTDEQIQRIKQISNVIDEKSEQIDLTLGYDGFNSLNKYGYVCRVRKKANKIWMEVKKKQEEGFFYETKIPKKSSEINDVILSPLKYPMPRESPKPTLR